MWPSLLHPGRTLPSEHLRPSRIVRITLAVRLRIKSGRPRGDPFVQVRSATSQVSRHRQTLSRPRRSTIFSRDFRNAGSCYSSTWWCLRGGALAKRENDLVMVLESRPELNFPFYLVIHRDMRRVRRVPPSWTSSSGSKSSSVGPWSPGLIESEDSGTSGASARISLRSMRGSPVLLTWPLPSARDRSRWLLFQEHHGPGVAPAATAPERLRYSFERADVGSWHLADPERPPSKCPVPEA
jgi:hypothetical protein